MLDHADALIKMRGAGTNYVMWWPFVVPPPAPYASSSAYFPTSSNNDMVSRYKITFGAAAEGQQR